MNMDGFRKMLENCSTQELNDLAYMITNQLESKEKEKMEKAYTVIKAWDEYKKGIGLNRNLCEVKIDFKTYDEKDHFVRSDYTYTTIKDISVNENGQIYIELNPILLTKRRCFPE